MKALVTGATGFLGSHIVDQLLERGDDVRALVRPSSRSSYLQERAVELVTGDVTDAASLAGAVKGVDVVYHAAAYVSDWGPWKDFRATNITGTRNTLKVARDAGVSRFLHVSTDGVYALRVLAKGVTEESPLERRFGWLDYYRRSKSAGERIARRYIEREGMDVTIVRPALLLGERDRAMLPATVSFLHSSSAAILGSGDNRIPYIYVGDVAAACVLTATSDEARGQIYNVVSDEAVTQESFLRTIADATGLTMTRRRVPVPVAYATAFAMEAVASLRGGKTRPALTRFAINLIALDYREDASKLRSLGWSPRVPLPEAVRRSIEWSHRKRPQPVVS